MQRLISLTATIAALLALSVALGQTRPTPPILFADGASGGMSPSKLALDSGCAAFSVPIDVKIGVPFTGASLANCYVGSEASTAAYSLATRDASPDPASAHFKISSSGVITNDASGVTAQTGNLWVRRVTSDGIAVEISLPWRIKP